MVKFITIIILSFSGFIKAANHSTGALPPKMQSYLESNFLSIKTEEDVSITAEVSRFDFDENVMARIAAFQSNLNGILEFDQKNYAQAYVCFKNASENGSIEALYFLGSLEMYGLGTKKNQSSAALKLQEAMNNGCRAAAFDLGQYYLFKDQPDLEQAKIIFSRHAKDMDFLFYLGITLFRQGEDEAIEVMQRAADLGLRLAQDYLASSTKDLLNLKVKKFDSHIKKGNTYRFDLLIKGLYSYCYGDHDTAFYQIHEAALVSRHSVEYNYLLAHMYFSIGDNAWGLKFLQHSAHHGYHPGKFDLGLRAYLGLGVKKDHDVALSMFNGSADAKFQYHCGLVLNDSSSDLDKRRGLLLIKEAAQKGFGLAQNSLKDSFIIVNDEWGSYLKARD